MLIFCAAQACRCSKHPPGSTGVAFFSFLPLDYGVAMKVAVVSACMRTCIVENGDSLCAARQGQRLLNNLGSKVVRCHFPVSNADVHFSNTGQQMLQRKAPVNKLIAAEDTFLSCTASRARPTCF